MRIPKGSIALMDDRHAQFLILLEEVCASAQLASLRVELHTTEGATIGGVPRATSPAGEIDDTGCHHTVRIDADEVALQEVVNFTVAAPERPPAAMADVHRRRPFLPESVH